MKVATLVAKLVVPAMATLGVTLEATLGVTLKATLKVVKTLMPKSAVVN
jgi:hypothetical protein